MPGFQIVDESRSGPPQECNSRAFLSPDKIKTNEERYSPQNTTETFRKYRYSATIYGLENNNFHFGNSPTLYLESCGRPKVELDKITIHHGQDEIYRPGKSRWSPINMTFYEAVGYNTGSNKYSWQVADAIYRWMNTVVTRFGVEKQDTRYSSIQKADALYRDVLITIESGDGYKLREYYLRESWPTSITPSELSYSSNELTKIEMELSYNRAEEVIYDGTSV